MEKDKFEELIEELNLNEIEDFDVKPAAYQVWLLGYDANQNITDYENLLAEFIDPEMAVKFAEKAVTTGTFTAPEDVVFVEIIVETIVDVDGIDTNVGTLFSEIIKIK